MSWFQLQQKWPLCFVRKEMTQLQQEVETLERLHLRVGAAGLGWCFPNVEFFEPEEGRNLRLGRQAQESQCREAEAADPCQRPLH